MNSVIFDFYFLFSSDKPHLRPGKPRALPHGPGTLVIHWDVPIPSTALEASVQYTGFRVEYRRDVPGAEWRLLGTTPADVKEISARSQLQPDVSYRFRVSLENWLGIGPPSEPSEPARLPVHGTTDGESVTSILIT